MSDVFLVLMLVGFVLTVAGQIFLLFEGFKDRQPMWGVGMLLLPFLWVVFAYLHWKKARVGAIVSCVGFVLLGGAPFVSVLVKGAG